VQTALLVQSLDSVHSAIQASQRAEGCFRLRVTIAIEASVIKRHSVRETLLRADLGNCCLVVVLLQG
jgi:hypothetical protein